MPILLDREIDIQLPTRTDVVLEETPRTQVVAGPPMDSSITVIENPEASGGQYLGLLFAGELIQSTTEGAHFRSTDYIRLDLHGNKVANHSSYQRVNREQGADPFLRGVRFHFLRTGDMGTILPNLSVVPFESAFYPTALHGLYRRRLLAGEDLAEAMSDVFGSIAKRVKSFGFNQESGRLILPHNYATFKPGDFRIGGSGRGRSPI